MRINNNIAALNTHRQLGINGANGQKAIEKLSSGLRINKAGDDAAGLSISEKMRAQVRGLNQASRNAQDGISLIQTAEGALNETHSILQRMRELAVQASNDTNTPEDRGEIQKEINQLTSEINRIGNTTEFNSQKLLNGNKVGAAVVGGPITELKSSVSVGGLTFTSNLTGTLGDAQEVQFVAGVGNNVALSAAYVAGTGTLTITLGTDGSGALDATKNTNQLISELGAVTTVFDVAITAGQEGALQIVSGPHSLTGGRNAGTVVAKDGEAALQIGSNQSQTFIVTINDMRAAALGIAGTAGATDVQGVTGAGYRASGGDMTGTDYTTAGEQALNVATATAASAAIKVFDKAIEKVSGERSKLGAYTNRLEHTAKNLEASSENLQAAESRIRDVDMAKEMMEFTKNNILSQAAQAMLAQANQQPQGVLQLLR